MNWTLERMIDERLDRGTDTLEDYYGALDVMPDDELDGRYLVARKGMELARAAGMEELALEWEDYMDDLTDERSDRNSQG